MSLQKRLCSECQFLQDDLLEPMALYNVSIPCPNCGEPTFKVIPSVPGLVFVSSRVMKELEHGDSEGIKRITNPVYPNL